MNWRKLLCAVGWHYWLRHWEDDRVEYTSGGLPILYQRKTRCCLFCGVQR
jgi:hypothetical protein